MIPTITRDELRARIDRGDSFVLFEVLGRPYWRKHHLPGAINLPPDRIREVVADTVPDFNTEIILYCWDEECPTSGWAARELMEMGYTRVLEYPGGKKDWQDAGLPMEKPST